MRDSFAFMDFSAIGRGIAKLFFRLRTIDPVKLK